MAVSTIFIEPPYDRSSDFPEGRLSDFLTAPARWQTSSQTGGANENGKPVPGLVHRPTAKADD
jgi:hypothetical protein